MHLTGTSQKDVHRITEEEIMKETSRLILIQESNHTHKKSKIQQLNFKERKNISPKRYWSCFKHVIILHFYLIFSAATRQNQTQRRLR